MRPAMIVVRLEVKVYEYMLSIKMHTIYVVQLKHIRR